MWNNGDGIPVEIHKEEQVYVPELIFGHLLTSSNYNDDEKKVCYAAWSQVHPPAGVGMHAIMAAHLGSSRALLGSKKL